jgi:hypothetical protein
MYKPDAIERNQDLIGPIPTFILSPIEGQEVKGIERANRIQIGSAIIDAMRIGFSDAGVVYSKEEMIASLKASLDLKEEEEKEAEEKEKIKFIIPDIEDFERIEKTFLGFTYIAQYYRDCPEQFAPGMKIHYKDLGGSNLDFAANNKIEEVVGRFHSIYEGTRQP